MADLGGKEAIRGFVHDELVPAIVSVEPPSAINVMVWFATYLADRGTPKIVAEERAELWHRNLCERIDMELVRWTELGANRPAWFADDERTLLTWNHPYFENRTGYPKTSSRYFEALGWIRDLEKSDFLVPCAIFLSSLGADPIYITDGSGDEGVDLIGMIKAGPLRSTIIFVQAKSSGRQMSRDEVLLEYGKYMHLPYTDKYRRYRKMLPNGLGGNSFVFVVVAKHGFRPQAQEIAGRLGILLRSDIQLALCVESQYETMSAVHEMEARMRRHLGANLENNVARFL